MADSSVAVTPGAGATVDTFTQASGDHRQAVVVGDAAAAQTVRVFTDGSTPVRKAASATGTLSSVAAATASTTLLAANTNRLGATFFNDSTAVLHLALAAAASTTAYTVRVAAGQLYELPNDGCGYVGPVSGVWAAANGAVRVTELT